MKTFFWYLNMRLSGWISGNRNKVDIRYRAKYESSPTLLMSTKRIFVPVEMKRYQLIGLVQQALQHSGLLHMCTQMILPKIKLIKLKFEINCSNQTLFSKPQFIALLI